MLRSELTLTGEIYRLTPDCWGNTSVMVDEDAVSRSTAEAFGIGSADPDADPNSRPESVEIARDANGNFYAILVPFAQNGVEYNTGMFKSCGDPATATDGSVMLYGTGWQAFEDAE